MILDTISAIEITEPQTKIEEKDNTGILRDNFSSETHPSETGLEGGARGARLPPPFLLQSLVCFAITLKNCKLCLLKLNWSLIMHPWHTFTIKTYLTPNHLLFGRPLVCYSKTTSAVIRNLTVLSSTSDTMNSISNHFWHRWRHKYVVNLCATQRTSKLNINSQKLCCASLWWKGTQTLLENCHSNRGIT